MPTVRHIPGSLARRGWEQGVVSSSKLVRGACSSATWGTSAVCVGTALFVALFVACGDSPRGDGATCSDPAPECHSLCEAYCAALTKCGQAPADCAPRCIDAYGCPGESRGQDQAICAGEQTRLGGATCTATCATTARWSGCAVDRGLDAAAGG